VLFRPMVLRYIRGSPKSKKWGVKNFVGVALFQSRVLVAPSSANLIRNILGLGKVFYMPLERSGFLLPVWSYSTLNFSEIGYFEPQLQKMGR